MSSKTPSPRKRVRAPDDIQNMLSSPPKKQSPPSKENDFSAKKDSTFESLKFEFSSDFHNRSWVDIVDEEEQRQLKLGSKNVIIKNEFNESNIELTEEKTESTRRGRKNTPTKNAAPRFVRSTLMSEALQNRRSNRIRKIENETNTNNEARKTYTPRKRRISTDSTSTVGSKQQQKNISRTSSRVRITHKSARYTSSTPTTPDNKNFQNSTSPMTPTPRDEWQQPNIGWCYDEKILERRTKEVEKAKEKPIYIRYIGEVQKFARKKGVHPRTPNKYLNYSRRSWDSQIKIWKRALYAWAGEEPSSSVNTSRCPSECGDLELVSAESSPKANFDSYGPSNSRLGPTTLFKDLNVHPDAAASLLGHFDLESRRGFTNMDEESTLKAPSNQRQVSGPTDFSQL